jgi:hypothetical protein
MTYRVFYGDGLAIAAGSDRRELHQQDGVRFERFSTEHEALSRARELLEKDERLVVAVHNETAGTQLAGVCLHLRLGYARE